MPSTIGHLVREGEKELAAAGIPSPRLDAEILLRSILACDRAVLLAHPEYGVPQEQERLYRLQVARRASHYPLQYLTGVQEFFGRLFVVSEAVLVPRPETELLVEVCLHELPPAEPTLLLDVGTGSGCLAVTLACERPGSRVVATDVSQAALVIAEENARRLGVSAQVELRLGEELSPVLTTEERFDLVVSNPPYVAFADPRVARDVSEFEPRQAVYAGPSGLEVIGRILQQAGSVLAPGAPLVLEVGQDQRPPVETLALSSGWMLSRAERDLAGHDRCLVFRRCR